MTSVLNIDKCQFITCVAAIAIGLLRPTGADAQPVGSVGWEPFKLEIAGNKSAEAELGRLTVPERRAAPARQIEIAFVRLRSSTANPGAPLIYLDGGPGGPGYTVVRIPALLKLFEAIRTTRDVILLSQRGIGLSTPVPTCPSSEPLPTDVFLSAESMVRALEPRTSACAQAWRAKGLDLAAYNSEESADDVEALRRALGVQQIALLGFSYGTHLGLSVIRRHPNSVERAILAGVEGPSHTWKLPTTFDAQFDKLSKAVGLDLVSAWRSVLARASTDPFRVAITFDGAPRQLTIGPAALQYFVRRDIGDTNDWPWIPTLITELSRGETTLLTRVAVSTYRGLGSGMRLMPLAMDCASGASAARLKRIRDEEPGSMLGTMTNFPFPAVCEILRVPMLPDGFRAALQSDVPALFISGTLDANAPAAQADEVATGFSHASSILVDSAGHESTLPLEAVQHRVLKFLGGEPVPSERLTAPLVLKSQAQPQF